MDIKRIGVFGGTFNPPHIGHLQSAELFIRSMNLDKLYVIPAFIPPHKSDIPLTDSQIRLQMTKLCFGDLKEAEVSDIEIKRQGSSYTYLTLEELSSTDAELFFLCGSDMFICMDKWVNSEEIFRLATVCCISRANDSVLKEKIAKKSEEYKDKYSANVHVLNCDPLTLSSTQIRCMINQGGDCSGFLSEKVYEYIKSKGLYL